MRERIACLLLVAWTGCGSRETAAVTAPLDAATSEVAFAADVARDEARPEAPDAPAPVDDAAFDGVAAETSSPPADRAVAPPDAGTVWRPAPGTSWQWQLTGTIDTSVDVKMYDLDLFDVPQSTVDALHAAGRVVICYFSAGSDENWRPDHGKFPPEALGRGLDGWPGERWLDTRSDGVRAVMRARLDLAAAKRCDGVEPDNVDGYSNMPGFPLTAATQLDFDRFLAGEAHARGLSVGLKNDVGQVMELEADFDWALNESCLQYDECATLTPFIRAGKAVFHVEYGDTALADKVCPKTKALGFSTLIKKQALDAWRVACP